MSQEPILLALCEPLLSDISKSQFQRPSQPGYSRRIQLCPNLHLPVTVSALSGGAGTASELHVSQDVEAVDVETDHQEEET